MDINNIKQLVELFEKSNINDMELESDGVKLKLSKNTNNISVVSENIQNTLTEQSKTEIKNNYKEITSPLVGTFYCAPAANAKPFVTAGQSVKEGEVLCIVEAMKVMNEIKSPCEGIVKEILVSDGELIQYGDTLMLIEEL